MKLNKLRFWNTSPSASTGDRFMPHEAVQAAVSEPSSNVVQMPARNALDRPAGLAVEQRESMESTSSVDSSKPAGLMDTPELSAFFAENFFGFGRHSGATYRTQDALCQGKQGVVSRFQNIASALIEQRQKKIDRLRIMQLQTEGICATTTAQLELIRDQLERDMTVLGQQIIEAELGKGWVLEALNRYQSGFGKGLREAIDFEFLSN